MHWAYGPLPRCMLTNDKTVQGHSGLGSSLVGHRAVIVPGSGTWVQCGHSPINGAAQELCWVLQT